jgi:hypothetical protein
VIQFLTTTSTVRLIEQVVVDAEDNLVLVSPAPRFSRKLAGQLQDACQRGVSIELIVDDVLFDEGLIQSLVDLDQFRILRCRDLNAQCYMNDEMLVITTMSISDLPSTGVHFGVAVSSDEQAYADADEHIKSIRNADGVKVTDVRREFEKSDVRKPRGLRAPIMRIVAGGLRKRWSAVRGGSRAQPVCEICSELYSIDQSTSGSPSTQQGKERALCPDCERRKRYQHTSLYLSADSM